MSAPSRKLAESSPARHEDLESQQRIRAELARSSTTLRRAPQPSEATIDAIQASLDAAIAQVDHLEQPRRMPPPLPKLPPPLPRAAPPAAPAAAPAPVAAAPSASRRSWLRRWFG